MEPFSSTTLFILFLGLIILISKGLYVLREYERAVIFRFGRLAKGLIGGNGPGIIIIIPLIDKLVRVSLRTVTMDVPPQDVITKDNVSVKVNAVIYFRVVRSGRITGVVMERSSSNPVFDLAAQRALNAADPLPPLPEGYRKSYLGVHFAFQYAL